MWTSMSTNSTRLVHWRKFVIKYINIEEKGNYKIWTSNTCGTTRFECWRKLALWDLNFEENKTLQTNVAPKNLNIEENVLYTIWTSIKTARAGFEHRRTQALQVLNYKEIWLYKFYTSKTTDSTSIVEHGRKLALKNLEVEVNLLNMRWSSKKPTVHYFNIEQKWI